MKESVREILEKLSWDEAFSREEIEQRIRASIAEELDSLCTGEVECKADRAYIEAIGEAQDLIRKCK